MGVQGMQSRQRCFGWKQVLATLMTLLLVVQVVMPIPQALACSGNGITDQGVVAAQGIDVPSAEENQMLQTAEAGKAGEPDELPGELGPRSSSTPAPETVQLIVDVCGNYDEATFAVFLPDGDTTPVTLQGPNEDKSVWPVVGSRVTARLTTYHQDGNWHYWFSKVVTGSGTWVLDDAFSAKLELDSPGYLVTFIPKEFIENPGFQRMRGLSAAGGAKTAIRVATRLVKKAGPDGALNAVDWTGALIDGFGVPDKFDELGKMLDTAVSCGENSTHYREQIDQMSMLVMGGEVAKWGLQLAGVLLRPETFGVGTVLLFGASKGVEYAIDKQIECHINGLKADMRTDLDCKLKDDDDPTKKIADPRWIFDPSGNVYEGLFENPLQGVLATVLEKVEHAGKTVMIPWDAEWYGQINPQLTDFNGYYGWDVPQVNGRSSTRKTVACQ